MGTFLILSSQTPRHVGSALLVTDAYLGFLTANWLG
jgi:hypothetical protein